MLKLIVLLLLLFMLKSSANAQEAQTDSLKKTEVAVRDADKYLKINKNIRKAYRQKSLSSTSDYFKPTLQITSNTNFLADSDYVRAYRHTGYESTVRQIQLNRTKVIIVAAVVAGAVAVIVIIVKLVDALGSALADGITKSVI